MITVFEFEFMEDSVGGLKQLLLGYEESIITVLPKVVMAILVMVLFVFLAKIARKATLTFYQKAIKKQSEIAKIISVTVYIFFLLSGVFLALQVVGLEKFLTHLLAGAGIVGIVAGFAFKDIASNIFAGMLLKFQNPFQINDWVEIDGNYGFITELGWITTTIMTVPGQEVFVPNQIIYSNTFKNFSTIGKRRIILETGVSYGDDLDHVRTVALDEVKNVAGVLPAEDMDFYFTQIGGSTYNFQLRFWINFQNNNDYQRAMSDVIIRIKKRFAQENISIAYPVTTLDFGVKGGVNIFDKPISVKESQPNNSVTQ